MTRVYLDDDTSARNKPITRVVLPYVLLLLLLCARTCGIGYPFRFFEFTYIRLLLSLSFKG